MIVVEPRPCPPGRRHRSAPAGGRRRDRPARAARDARREAHDPDRRRARTPGRPPRARSGAPPHRRARLSAARSRSTTRRAPSSGSLELDGSPPVRIHRTLLDADLVVCVTAAETSERGGACDAPRCVRGRGRSLSAARAVAAGAVALARPACSRAGSPPRSRGTRPVTGVSIVLDHPRLSRPLSRLPSSPAAVTAIAHSPLRRLVNVLPGRGPQTEPCSRSGGS